MMILVILFITSCCFSRTATRKDDAYHFEKAATKNMWYVEWWYFNWACPNDLSGIYVYGTWNPSEEFDLGFSILYALHYSNSSVKHTADLHSAKDFSASYDQADVTILNTNKIRVINDEKYSVVGSSGDKAASWDFNVTGIVEPWFFYENSSVGPKWQELSWLVYMPRARVSGSVYFDGKHHQLDNCIGYHDHDWGRWEAFEITWGWLQYSNDEVTVVAGAGRESGKYCKANNLWLKYEDLFLKFNPDDCRVNFTKFVESDIPLHKYPTHVHYVAKNDDYVVDIQYEVVVSPGIWRAAVVVFEQKSKFNGVVKDKDGNVVTSFEGIGFSEWTDHLV